MVRAQTAENGLQAVQTRMRACRLCLEEGHDIIPGAIFSGESTARVFLLGQAPGVTEVEAGRPFNASSGRRLFEWLGAAGWNEDAFRHSHYMTAVTKCYPGPSASGRGDRVPGLAEQALCRPFLEQELSLVNPALVIPVGGLAIRQFYPARTRLRDVVGTARYFAPHLLAHSDPFDTQAAQPVSQFDPALNRQGRWLVPLPHPSGASSWPNRAKNRVLIDRAITILASIRAGLRL